MQGLELARRYFETYGLPLLENEFAAQKDQIAAGLVGRGSECFGYDDEQSKDHDFEAGFCFWLSDEAEQAFGFPLMRAYNRLPKSFLGVKMQAHSYYGNSRVGVFRISDFYRELIGLPRAPETAEEWLYTPEYALSNATNGAVFYDGAGVFSSIRQTLLDFYPEDVRRKKIAACLCISAQSGQYNFSRCLVHGEPGAALLARNEFVTAALHLLFLLEKRYMPFYKWQFRAARELPGAEGLPDRLTALLSAPANETTAEEIEKIAAALLDRIAAAEIVQKNPGETYLEPYAFSVLDTIENRALRTMHILDAGIE